MNYKFNSNLALQLLLIIVFGFCIYSASSWPSNTRAYAWFFSIPGLVFMAILLYQTIASRKRTDGQSSKAVEKQELVFFAWLIGFILAVLLLGFKIALMLYVLFFLRFQARRSLWVCFGFAGATYIFAFIIVEYFVGSSWPAGIIPG